MQCWLSSSLLKNFYEAGDAEWAWDFVEPYVCWGGYGVGTGVAVYLLEGAVYVDFRTSL